MSNTFISYSTYIPLDETPEPPQNPYQSPRAYATRDSISPQTPRELEYKSLRRLAICQRMLLVTAGAKLAVIFGPILLGANGYRLTPSTMEAVSLIGMAIGIAAVASVAIRVNGWLAGSMLAILTFIPCADYLIMLAVHQQANMHFRRFGVPAGLLGPRWSDLTLVPPADDIRHSSSVGPVE